jgi:DnaA family protein
VPSPRQYTLAIERPHEQSLDTFVSGVNTELAQALAHRQQAFAGYWIYGTQGSGRSHLLRGCCLATQQRGQDVTYVGCSDYLSDAEGLRAALQHAQQLGETVAVDDIAAVAGNAALETLLMTVYQRLLSVQGRLLVSHTHPAQTLQFVLPDLASRMRSLQHFQIQALADDDKVQVLRQRAQNRGYELSQPVLDYWLSRGPRDLGALLTDLETLDKASLAQHQKVTIPLLKQVLGY